MGKLKFYFIKVLKRLKLLRYFNFKLSKSINGLKVKIPFMFGMGLSNFSLEPDWLDLLIIQFTDKNDPAFVDVGVNLGQTLIKVKTLRPDMKYLGFEPNSACNFYTQHLIKVNNFQDCTIHNCALFSMAQIIILEKSHIYDPRASIIALSRPGFFKEKECVIGIDYDSLNYNQSISFIKIDVEFAELEVITGMKRSIIKYYPFIVCEVLDSHQASTHDFTQLRATELSRLLLSLNYSIIRLKTSREKNKIISFEKLDEIFIEQWTQESYYCNDYLFYPAFKAQEVWTKLTQACG